MNSTIENEFLEILSLDKNVRYFTIFMILCVIILGSIGNLLTIIALSKCKKVHSTVTIFVISLSTADLLHCLIPVPLYLSSLINGWKLGEVMCGIWLLLVYSNAGVSLFNIAAISINRCIYIVYDELYRKIFTKLNIIVILIFCWITPYLVIIPAIVNIKGEIQYYHSFEQANCRLTFYVHRLLSSIGIGIPCLVIILAYVRIGIQVRESSIKLNNYGTEHQVQLHHATKSDWKLIKMLLVIFSSFTICYFPAIILALIKEYLKKSTAEEFYMTSNAFVHLSSCINPIIYAVLNSNYRHAYKNLLRIGFNTNEQITQISSQCTK